MDEDTSLNENGLYHTYGNTKEGKGRKRINRNALLDLIRKKQPLSIWSLKTISQLDYASLWRIIRDLEFCGLIETRSVTNKDNREERVIVIPDKEVKK